MKFRTAISMFALSAGLASGAAYASTFVVDTTADAVDVAPGDGVCLSADGACTLRAAVMEADAFAGADTIDLTAMNDPLDPITLTLVGVDETLSLTPQGAAACVAVTEADAAVGDLDITEDLTIQGAGPGLTVVRWAAQGLVQPAVGDRIFHIQANPGETVNRVRIADLMVTNGGVGVPVTLDAANPYNCEVTGSSGSRQAWQFRRFGGAIAVGAGAAVVLFDEALHGDGDSEPERIPDADYTGAGAGKVAAVELAQVAVVGNRSGSDGGGVDAMAPLTIEDSVFSANAASADGGALSLEAASTIAGTLIGDASTDVAYLSGPVPAALLGPNTAANGGGIFATGSHTSSIERSAINLNQATSGGAIAGRTLVRLNVSNTTISGNTVSDVGGGITTSGIVTLLNVTLANNRSTSGAAGGGAGLNGIGSGTYLFSNTLLSNNVVQAPGSSTVRKANCGCTGLSPQCSLGVMVSRGTNLSDETTDTCTLSTTIGDQLNANPLLGTLADNGGRTETHRLPSTAAGDAATSPAIDAAANDRCPNNDQRGSLRPDNGDADADFDCDVGAFELFVPRGDLNIGNVIAPNSVKRGDTFQMVIRIRNDNASTVVPAVTYSGTVTPATGLAVVGAATTAGTCTIASGSSLNCALGDMAAGAVATVTLTLTANAQDSYAVKSVVANDPSLTDPVPKNNTVTSRVGVTGVSDIELSVNLDTDTVAVERDFTFDYVISNNGADDANNVRLGVRVPRSVSFFSASYEPGYACYWDVGQFLCQVDELAVGETAAFRLIVTAVTTGDYAFQATVVADQPDPDAVNNDVDTAVKIVEKPRKSGGGGCAYDPGSAIDPTLPALLAVVVVALFRRRRAR